MVGVADPADIACAFSMEAEVISAERYGSGHINDTYLVTASRGNDNVKFVLQRINKDVFSDPVAVMENIRRVTEHLKSHASHGSVTLDIVPSNAGDDLHVDTESNYWRMYRHLDGTRSYDVAPSIEHAGRAAAEFGRFHKILRDLPEPRLHEVIPEFHNTPARYSRFHEVLSRDEHQRAGLCGREIERALEYEECAGALVSLLARGEIPERVIHNDTKINNVMFDMKSGKAVCIVDLDTVMPGLGLYDFGDLVRTASTTAAEDETDLSAMTMRPDYYEALVEGYLSEAAAFLLAAEVEHLPLAAKIITIEIGLRFLTDYLSGDVYFRTQRPGHNLDRCRAQFALADSIDGQLGTMQTMTSAAWRRLQ